MIIGVYIKQQKIGVCEKYNDLFFNQNNLLPVLGNKIFGILCTLKSIFGNDLQLTDTDWIIIND